MQPSLPSLPITPDKPWLAPLAGFSDLPFRLLCRERGAAAACTEMVSAKGLIYGLRGKKTDNATEALLRTTAADQPLIVQLFGADPVFIHDAAKELRDRGYLFFDLNLGCSVPKVTRTGAGAALLKEPRLALEVAAALFRAAGPGRAGCKLRLGWDAGSEVYMDLARGLQDAGAAWITLHPRYARQGFGGEVRLEALEKLAAGLQIPVLASGDLFRPADAMARLDLGISGLMFARGAMADPTIFSQYLALLKDGRSPEPPDAGALRALISRHAALARQWGGGVPGRSGLDPALLKMRGFAPRYLRHLPGAKAARAALARCSSWEELEALLKLPPFIVDA